MRDLVLGKDRISERPAIIAGRLRHRHVYVLGRTGAGKSSLLHRLIHQDAKHRRPPYAVAVFDAGDLVPSILETLPDSVLPRVRFFSVENPIPYNPLLRRRDEPARLENELCSLMDQVTAEASSTGALTARMKRLLSVCLREVLKESQPTLSTVANHLLERRTELQTALALRADEFAITWEGVIDRLSQFLRDPRIRRVICAPSELDFEEILDEGLILLVSLAGLEPQLKRFLGTLLFHGLQATILDRPRDRRRSIALFADEFQDFVASRYAVQNFQVLFAQGRRYGAALAVAHQDFGTIDSQLLHTIHGNVASSIAFSCGVDEARQMSALFGGEYQPHTLAFLPDHEAVCRVGEKVYNLETYPPPTKVREIEKAHLWAGIDPPDPFDAFIESHREPKPGAQRRRAPTWKWAV